MNNTSIHITIISVFPELHESFVSTSLVKRAVEKGLVSFSFLKLSDFVEPKKRIDAPACGPGAGMVIKAEVAEKALEHAYAEHGRGATVFFSPQGRVFNSDYAQRLAVEALEGSGGPMAQSGECPPVHHIVMFCGRYEGVDARVEREYATHLISIGDFVLMGGDVPAQVVIEALLRFVPGVVGDPESVAQDSFEGPFLDWPTYALPNRWKHVPVPPILFSGHHAQINEWRKDDACRRTLLGRFDWVRSQSLSPEDRKYVHDRIPGHYVILMHDQVLIGKTEKVPGVTSVTTIDLHDIARSCATYGIKKFFIVTPLKDQQKLLDVFLNFWHTSKGKSYNSHRFEAMSLIHVCSSIQDAIDEIAQLEGLDPITVATSAKLHDETTSIGYSNQSYAWGHGRPVALVFGTGQGLVSDLVANCSYVLRPVEGFPTYNHLSVRCAVAIVLDRWIGLRT